MVYAARGPLDPEKHEHAKKNIEAFVTDLRARGLHAVAVLGSESEGDRFVYRMTPDGSVSLQMPGVPLEQTRRDDRAPAGFELVINDVYQTWKGALDLVAARLKAAGGKPTT